MNAFGCSLLILVLWAWVIALIRSRRPWHLIFGSLGVLVMALFSGIVPLLWFSIPPSDLTIKARFVKHRYQLEILAAMMKQDKQMYRISDDFIDPKGGISTQRLNQYRKLIDEAEIERVCRGGHTVSFTTWSAGFMLMGSSIEYVRCGKGSEEAPDVDFPCREQANSGSGHDVLQGLSYRYQRLDEDWFILQRSS